MKKVWQSETQDSRQLETMEMKEVNRKNAWKSAVSGWKNTTNKKMRGIVDYDLQEKKLLSDITKQRQN